MADQTYTKVGSGWKQVPQIWYQIVGNPVIQIRLCHLETSSYNAWYKVNSTTWELIHTARVENYVSDTVTDYTPGSYTLSVSSIST